VHNASDSQVNKWSFCLTDGNTGDTVHEGSYKFITQLLCKNI